MRLGICSDTRIDPSESRAIAALLLRTGIPVEIVAPADAECLICIGTSFTGAIPSIELPRHEYTPEAKNWKSDLWRLLIHLKDKDPFNFDPFATRVEEHSGTRPGVAHLNLDLPGLFRAVLEGWEDIGAPEDEHGRTPPEKTISGHVHVLHRPWLDEIGRAFGDLLCELVGKPRSDSAPSWSFCPTFDIDSAGMFAGRGAVRHLRNIAKKGPVLFSRALFMGARVQARIGRDPHLHIREIGEALEGLDVPATFFFQTHRRNRIDNYTLSKSRMLLAELKILVRHRYHRIGLHSSYATRDETPDFFGEQWRALRKCAGGSVVAAHRAHYLRTPPGLAYPTFPGKHDGIDSSVTFGAREGFRRGTALPYRVGDRLIEMPPCVLDSTFVYHHHSTPEKAFDTTLALMNRVQKTGGIFVPVWHPHNMEPFLRPGWDEVLWDIVREAKKRGAHCQSLARTTHIAQDSADIMEKEIQRLFS